MHTRQTSKNARLLILECLDSSRPLGLREKFLHTVLGGQLSKKELRSELQSLNEHGFIELSEVSGQNWYAKIKLAKARQHLSHLVPDRRLH